MIKNLVLTLKTKRDISLVKLREIKTQMLEAIKTRFIEQTNKKPKLIVK